MLLQELSNEFDILFEELATAGSKGLDEYEKSICFTYAQSLIVDDLIKTKTYSFSQNLLTTLSLIETTVTDDIYGDYCKNYATDSKVYKILGYVLRGNRNKENFNISIPGLEVTDSEIQNMLALPYKYPPKDLAYVLRVQDAGDSTKIVSAIFAPFKFVLSKSLFVKCILTPTPIILETLVSESIRDTKTATKPILDDFLQEKLVEGAVMFAIEKYIGLPEKEIPNK